MIYLICRSNAQTSFTLEKVYDNERDSASRFIVGEALNDIYISVDASLTKVSNWGAHRHTSILTEYSACNSFTAINGWNFCGNTSNDYSY